MPNSPNSFDRSRVRRYLEAQPYRSLFITDDEEQLFFFEEIEGQGGSSAGSELRLKKALRRPATNEIVDGPVAAFDMPQAQIVSPLNFMGKSANIVDYFAETNELLLLMDEANEEKYNLHLLDLGSGLKKQLTHVAQALVPRTTRDRCGVWFTSREARGDGSFISTLCRVDLQSSVVTRFFNDERGEYKLNFVAPLEYSPERIFIFMDKGARRTELQLFDIHLTTGERRACLNDDYSRHRNYLATDEACGEEVFFTSMKNGYENLYAYNITTREVRVITSAVSKNTTGLRGMAAGCEAFIYQIFDRLPSRDSDVVLSDLEGREFLRRSFSGGVYPLGNKNTLWIQQASMTQTPRLVRVHSGRKKHLEFNHAADELVIDLLKLHDERERADFVHGTRQIASYKSYDGLDIPAFLFLPKAEVKGAIVIAFYGGEDYYVGRYQMYLEQGIAILSPAVRGSWSWGQEWENHLKGDLGGGEILDVIWGARFVAKVLGLEERQVGVEGGSHGGYAVLRTLTLPKDFRGVDSSFNFGFGICWAGFADLVDFHQSSWISDWLVDLLGPIAANEALYRERSPANYVHELRAPLFISHGRNDRRVPLSTMTAFLDQLAATPFEHSVWLQDGEGHKAGGRDKEADAIMKEFDFLARVLGATAAGAPTARATGAADLAGATVAGSDPEDSGAREAQI